ncbi:MAG: RraA family protein [Alphaproteobacteria bacterium]
MALTLNPAPKPLLDARVIASWQGVPAAIVTDELNRAGAMDAAIKPVATGSSFVGQALTVECMVADNSALHYALTIAWPAAVLVVNAGGFLRTAVWGSILHRAGELKGLAAVVVDGAVRDLAELRRSRVPVYARGGVPAGPHKGWGGAINAPIQCGGVPVAPGDLLVGDDDGIAVVRPDQMAGLLERCRARMAKEVEMVAKIEAGARTVDLIGLPSVDKVGKG